MTSLEGKRALVTGGSRGIGLGIVEALVARKARVTVLARDAGRLAEVSKRLGVDVRTGDASDEATARAAISEVRPEILVLNAGTTPRMGPIHEISWEAFSEPWEKDVKSGLFWIRHAIALPLPPGSRVLLGSSGAAVNGSPLSGGYAGAKRMLWLMARYANGVASELGLGIHFQALVPLQLLDTDLGRAAAAAYANKRGVGVDAVLDGFGKPLSPRDVGDHVTRLLSDPALASGVAFGVKGDSGLTSLDG